MIEASKIGNICNMDSRIRNYGEFIKKILEFINVTLAVFCRFQGSTVIWDVTILLYGRCPKIGLPL